MGGQEGWKHFHKLSQERYKHAAVVMQDDTIVIVGHCNWGNGDGKEVKTGEIVKSGTVFDLQNGGQGTCALLFQSELVMIGGEGAYDRYRDTTHGKVDRYDSEGKYLGSLPDLNRRRWRHACSTFFSSEGEQGLLVAGGYPSGSGSSTELYLPSNKRWISGGDLPRRLYGPKAAHLDERVVLIGVAEMTGSFRDEVLEFDASIITWEVGSGTGQWAQIGSMDSAREDHAIVEANLSAICPEMGVAHGLWLELFQNLITAPIG